jgi:phosphoribosylglycinamide formyltransferase 1
MADVLKLAVLASGAGTNLQAMIDAIATGALPARIVGMFSDKPSAAALARAQAAGLPAEALSPKDFDSRAAFDAALFARVDAAAPDLIVCAGYMRIISAEAIQARPKNRMINLHPSLLPAFKGLHTHRQALAAGVREHGASVHVVTADLDDGPVLAQARVPVQPDDDETTLAARVRGVEHPLLLATVAALADGRLQMGPAGLFLNGEGLAAPLQLGDDGRLASSGP